MKKTVLFFFLLLFFIPVPAGAFKDSGDAQSPFAQANIFSASSGVNYSSDAVSIIAKVIIAGLGLLGMIFVFLMIYAGYNWMTASGEEEKIELAKKTIKRAIIGLVITVSAYAITSFVLSRLPYAYDAGASKDQAPTVYGTGE